MAGLWLLGGLLLFWGRASSNRGGYPSFTDEIPFKITWPGAEVSLVVCIPIIISCIGAQSVNLFTLLFFDTSCVDKGLFVCMLQPTSGALYSEDDFVIMTTAEKEKYKCLLPSLAFGEEVRKTPCFTHTFKVNKLKLVFSTKISLFANLLYLVTISIDSQMS